MISGFLFVVRPLYSVPKDSTIVQLTSQPTMANSTTIMKTGTYINLRSKCAVTKRTASPVSPESVVVITPNNYNPTVLECSSTIRPVSAGVISKHNLSSTCVAFRTVSIETDTSKCSDDPSLPSALTPCSLGSSKISHRVQRSTKSWKRQAIEEIHN